MNSSLSTASSSTTRIASGIDAIALVKILSITPRCATTKQRDKAMPSRKKLGHAGGRGMGLRQVKGLVPHYRAEVADPLGDRYPEVRDPRAEEPMAAVR